MGQITCGGSLVTLTPDAASAIDVTINGKQYTEAFDTDIATTIDNFITNHAQDLLDNYKYPVLATDGTTLLNLHGAALEYVSAENATLAESYEGIAVPVTGVVSHSVSSSSVVINLDTANTAADVVTLTCLNAAHAEEVNKRISFIRQKKGGSVNAVSPAIA